MITHVFKTNELAQKAADALNKTLKDNLDKPVLFLISGGSSLALLEHIDTSLFTVRSRLTVSDERYSTDPNINNLAQIEKTQFYTKAIASGATAIDTKPKASETMMELAKRFDTELKAWVSNNPDGAIIASAGIGPDAHTAGIMPYPEDVEFFDKTFDDKSKWAVAYDAQNKNQYPLRITISLPFIRKIDYVAIYASGESKKPALKKLCDDSGNLNESPCRIWREIKNVELFTDIDLLS